MSATTPALLAAAAGVGFGHAILPDHWVPLAVLGRTRRYPIARVARLSGLAGVAHVLVSILLGSVVILVGLQLRSSIQSAQGAIVGAILIATGVGFAVMELTGHGHHHHHDAAGHSHGHHDLRGGLRDAHRHHADHDHDRHDHDRHDHDRHDHHHDGAHHGAHHDHAHGHASAATIAQRARRRGTRGLAAIVVPFGAAASPDLTILPVFLAAAAAGTATAISSLLIFAGVTIATIVTLTLLACFSGYQIRGQWLERWGNALTALVLVAIGALVAGGVI